MKFHGLLIVVLLLFPDMCVLLLDLENVISYTALDFLFGADGSNGSEINLLMVPMAKQIFQKLFQLHCCSLAGGSIC
ncbi:unnamed protein product [Urochloa humidicola]